MHPRFAYLATSLAIIASLATAAGPAATPARAATGDPVLINEVVGSTTGIDVEYIELFGTPGAPLDGLSLIVVESDDEPANGRIEFRLDLDDTDALGENGFYLVGTATVFNRYGVMPNREIPTNRIENSSYTLALVETASVTGGNVTGSEVVLDALGVTDGDAADTFFFGAPVIGPDGSFLPAGGRRVVDGVDTDTAADWALADFFLGSENTPTAGTGDGGGPVACFDDIARIGAVQGSGDVSPCVDKLAAVQGVVTRVAVDLLPGAGVEKSLDGFFIQDEGDGDASTSDGIFIFLEGLSDADRDDYDDVQVGDRVTVEGEVSEFFGLTEITAASITTESLSNPLPNPTPIDLVALEGALEPYESMLVQTGELFAANNFDFDRFGEIEAYPFLAFQPTELHAPGSPDYFAELDLLDAGRLIVDDLRGGSFNQPVPYFVSDAGVDRVVRWGDSLPQGLGILGFSFGNYRLYPLGNPLIPGETFQPTNPRPAVAPNVGGSLRVASLNTLNFWTNDGGQERGARTQRQYDIQSEKLVAAILRLDADVLALQELQNDPQGDLATSDDFAVLDEDDRARESAEVLAALVNEALGYQRYAFIDTGVIGTDAIKVGFLYDRTTVRRFGRARLVDDRIDPRYDDDRNRPTLVQVFLERATSQPFVAASVHFKSKGNSGIDDGAVCPALPGEDPRNCDQGDGAGFWNFARAQAAGVLRDYLDTLGERRWWWRNALVLGDFNAYSREDPVQAFEGAGWFNLDELSSEPPVSFVFSGLAGNLDHAFANWRIAPKVTDAELDDINGTESFETAYFGPLVEEGTEFRSSDHSPLLIGLDLRNDDDDDEEEDDD